MRKRQALTVFVLCLLAQSFLFGQTYKSSLEETFVEGYVVRAAKKDTLKCKIWYQPFYQMEQTIIAAFDEGDYVEKVKYSPSDLLSFGCDEVTWVSTKHSSLICADRKDRFVIAHALGGISYFKYYIVDKEKPTGYNENSCLQKAGEKSKLVDFFLLGFKKSFSKYIAEYEELATKVKNKEKGYRMLSLNKIVDEYNEWYKKNNPDYTVFNK